MIYDYTKISTEETTRKTDHHLVREPEYLSDSEMMASFGFIKIMTIIWSPLILTVIILILKNKVIKR